MYEATHFSKNGDFVSEHFRKLNEKYKAKMVEKYGEDVTQHPMLDPDALLVVRGPPKKNMVQSTGVMMDVGFPSLTSTPYSNSGVGIESSEP